MSGDLLSTVILGLGRSRRGLVPKVLIYKGGPLPMGEKSDTSMSSSVVFQYHLPCRL
jgi:hypothetical protein